MTRYSLLTFALVSTAAFAQAAPPTAAQFQAALADACPQPRQATRNIACAIEDAGSVQYSCRYEAQGADGRWTQHTAILQRAEGQWVWIDGPTRCDDTNPELN
jgi:uncharacterized protein YchJ